MQKLVHISKQLKIDKVGKNVYLLQQKPWKYIFLTFSFQLEKKTENIRHVHLQYFCSMYLKLLLLTVIISHAIRHALQQLLKSSTSDFQVIGSKNGLCYSIAQTLPRLSHMWSSNSELRSAVNTKLSPANRS